MHPTRSSCLVAIAAVAISCLCTPPISAQPTATRPNIIYILADDQGWKDVGFHGSDIKTPTLDRLAAQGAVLNQFYSQAMCTPSRAALMTGRYPHRYGLQTAVIPSAGTYGLATDEWLLPQALKEVGYETAIVGKWHLGHADRQVLASAARLRLSVWTAARRNRLLHARRAWQGRLVPKQQAGDRAGVRDGAHR